MSTPNPNTGYTFQEGICHPIQRKMVEYFDRDVPQFARNRVGFIDALNSDMNRMGWDVLNTNGKNRKVELTYSPRYTGDTISRNPDDLRNCSQGTENPLKAVEVSADLFSKQSLKIDEADMRLMCDNDQVYMNEQIMSAVNSVIVDMNQQVITAASTTFGTYRDGSTTKDFELFTSNNPVTRHYAQMKQEYKQLGGTGAPILVGDCILDEFDTHVEIGCCNNFGVDLSQARTGFYFNDEYVPDILSRGSDCRGIMMIPGRAQFVQWQRNVGPYRKPWNGREEFGTIVDPLTGIELDVDILFDNCDRVYYIHMYAFYNYYVQPMDAYHATDTYFGTNGVVEFNVTAS